MLDLGKSPFLFVYSSVKIMNKVQVEETRTTSQKSWVQCGSPNLG